MEDPKEREVRELAQALTGQQLRSFIDEFPEFNHLTDSPALRHLVSHALLFSSGAFENDVYLISRIDAFRGLCLELLQGDTTGSALYPWIANVGKGKKGAGNLEKFIINFQKFLAPKIGGIVKPVNQNQEHPFFSRGGQGLLFFGKESDAITAEDVENIVDMFSMLQSIARNEKKLAKLAEFIKQMSMAEYKATYKYQWMYKILKIGNILHSLLPNLKTKNSVGVLEKCSPGVAQVKLLNNSQQFAAFYLSRDISADFFHLHYDKKIEDFVNHFLMMLKGTCRPIYLVETYREGNDAVRGTGPRGTKKYLSHAIEGDTRINKLFCQAGYFVLKAMSFLKNNDFESACMALVGAGDCGKDFNRSTLNPVKEGSVMEDLYIIRNRLSHVLEQEYNEAELFKWLTELDFHEYLTRLEKEAEQMGNPINIRDYYERKEGSDDEQPSPRAYDATRFDH